VWTTQVASGAGASQPTQTNLMLHLRSFTAGASAQLEVEPTATGGRARLRATNLPPPGTVAPGAKVYLVWATGGRVVRLGELRRNARGSAALEFAHPASFQRYSLIVTAEENARTDHPGGAPVFSTRANEVTAVFPAPADLRPRKTEPPARTTESPTRTTESPARTTDAPPARLPSPRAVVRTSRGGPTNGDFFAEVEEALRTDASARDIRLVGTRLAPRARGQARVAATGGSAYVRTRLRRVPAPARLGADRYVLWALTAEGRSLYLGSLPRRGLNGTDSYVRAGGVAGAEQFDLLVTAESGRRVRGVRRVLATPRRQRVYRSRRAR
jgi:hypothetical protein